MYPQQELSRLAAQKSALRRDVAVHRFEFAEAMIPVTKSVALIDRTLVVWRRLSQSSNSTAKPLDFLITRVVLTRLRILDTLTRWGPLVFAAVRAISSGIKNRRGSSESSKDGTEVS